MALRGQNYCRESSAPERRLRSRYRPPGALIDRLVIVLGTVALLAGISALFGSLHVTVRNTTTDLGVNGHSIGRWQLAVLLAVFAGLVALNFTRTRPVRQASGLLALAIALTGFVTWWWAAVDGLLAPAYISVGHVALGGGMILAGFSLGLQIVVGLLMFTAAFPMAAEASAGRTP